MAIPTLDSSAAAVEGTGTTLAVPYPSTVNSGDQLILTYGVSHATGAATPTDWTLQKTASQSACTAELYTKSATGSETGTLTFTVNTDGEPKLARMFRSTDADSIEAIDSSSATGKILNHPAITSTDVDRLAMAVTSINDDESASSFTGESNGDLTLLVDDTTALDNDHALSMQTADLALAVTLSGGTWSFSGANENWVTIGFAIFQSPSFTQTDKTINFSVITTMALTKFPIRPKSISFGMVTGMGLTKLSTFFRTFNVAFSTAMALSKIISKPLSVGFVTTMATTTANVVTRTINVAFVTAMSMTKLSRFLVSSTVGFITAMAVARTTFKSFAVGLGLAIGLTKETQVQKTVTFSTGMVTSTASLVNKAASVTFNVAMAVTRSTFKSISFAFNTAMSTAKSTSKILTFGFSTAFTSAKTTIVTKTITLWTFMALTTSVRYPISKTVSFIVTMLLATSFISGAGNVFGAALIFLRRRRGR